MIKWVVVLSLMLPDGTLTTTQDRTAYTTKAACDDMRAIRLSHVLEILTKNNVRVLDVKCMPQ